MTVQDLDTTMRDHVRSFLEQNLLYLRPEVSLGDSDDLVGLGLIDSMGFVELVEEVACRYGLDIPVSDITEAHFGSVDAVVAYVKSRLR